MTVTDPSKITSITVTHQDGTVATWHGSGTVHVVATQTKADDLAQPYWPTSTWVQAQMLIEPDVSP